MRDDLRADPPGLRADPPAQPRARQAKTTSTWAWVAVLAGLFLVVASLIPSFLDRGVRLGIVLGDAEVVPVTGMVVFVLGALVLLQEWSGLT